MLLETEARQRALNALYESDRFFNRRQQRAENLIRTTLPRLDGGKTLLEIGTGMGDIFRILSEEYPGQIYSLDIDDYVPPRNKAQFDRSCTRVIADARAIPFNSRFDFVFICFVLHHLSDQDIDSVIEESLRVGERVVIVEHDIDFPLFGSLRTRRLTEKVIDGLTNIGVPGGMLANHKSVTRWQEIFKERGANEIKHRIHSFSIGPLQFHQSIFELSCFRQF